MSNAAQVLVRRSTNVIELKKLRDKVTGLYYNDLTVSVTIKDSNGANVAGATALNMPYVAGTTGASTTYRVAVAASVVFSDDTYTAVMTITRAGIAREINIACTAIDG